MVGQHIYEINADPALKGDTLSTLGEDLCVVANLKMEIRPITFTVHTAYCNESFATLCQKVIGILPFSNFLQILTLLSIIFTFSVNNI